MPYGLPGAIVLSEPVEARTIPDGKKARCPAGTKLAPIHPGADQDGYDQEWICRDIKSGLSLAIPAEALTIYARTGSA